MPNLDAILNLATANRYTYPQTASEPLPFVLGNFLSSDVLPDDDDDGGFTPVPCIDRVNLVYLLHDGPMASTAPQVYLNGTRQSASAYIFDPTSNYEGRGAVGTIRTYVKLPRDAEITVRHGGAVDAQGVAITNPLRGLIYVLQKYNGWTNADFDWGTVQRSMLDLDTLSYPVTYCFAESGVTVREWLLDFLAHYHCDADVTGDGKLAIIHDRSLTALTIVPDFHVEAWMIKDHGVPWTAISKEKQLDDLCNQAVIQTRYNWAAGQYTGSFVGDFVQSQAGYQTAYPTDFAWRGMYTTQHATNWLNAFFTRHGFEPTIRRLTLNGLRYTPLIPPRLITVEWPPYGWSRRLMKIRRRTTSEARREVILECIDCQRELGTGPESVDTTITSRRERISRIYQWIPGTVGDEGLIEDGPGPTKNEAANGDFELGPQRGWTLTGLGGVAQWTIEENPSEAYQGRFYARSVAGMPGYGSITLKRRIDPGEWVMVSGWFRRHASNANGEGVVIVQFFDTNGDYMEQHLGAGVPPTDTYLESVLLVQAPAGVYHYRPGFGLFPIPTAGQWRADKIIARSGSRGELLTSRLDELGTGSSFVINGGFESGFLNWQADAGWYADRTFPLQGAQHATHVGRAGDTGVGRRLYNLTRVFVVPTQRIQVQGFIRRINANGQFRFGATWFSATNSVISESASEFLPGGTGQASHDYLWWGGVGPAPTNAATALTWAETSSHTIAGTYWCLDEFSCGNPYPA